MPSEMEVAPPEAFSGSVLHQNEGGIGKSIPDAQEISLRSQEISWASGMDFPIRPEFWWMMRQWIITTISQTAPTPRAPLQRC